MNGKPTDPPAVAPVETPAQAECRRYLEEERRRRRKGRALASPSDSPGQRGYGLTRDQRNGKWKPWVKVGPGKNNVRWLGSFATREIALKVRAEWIASQPAYEPAAYAVVRDPRSGRWTAYVRRAGKRVSVGVFPSERQAIEARDRARGSEEVVSQTSSQRVAGSG